MITDCLALVQMQLHSSDIHLHFTGFVLTTAVHALGDCGSAGVIATMLRPTMKHETG